MKDKKLTEYYDTRASEYEQIYFRDNPERRREIDEETGRLRELARGRQVLEVACGTGYWAKVMTETAKMLVATDYSAEMLNEASKKEYQTKPAFIRSDLYQLPFEAKQFDLVALGFWFSHHPREDYQNLFDILKYPLRPDGLIWMIDNNPPAEGPDTDSVRLDERGNNYKKRLLDSGEEHIILKNYFSKSELENIFNPFFEIVRLTYGEYYWIAVLANKPG